MNLTYRVTATGYEILKDGAVWIVQDGYIPFKRATMEESAQAHIDDIIANAKQAETAITPEERIEKLETQNADLAEAIINLQYETETEKLGGNI